VGDVVPKCSMVGQKVQATERKGLRSECSRGPGETALCRNIAAEGWGAVNCTQIAHDLLSRRDLIYSGVGDAGFGSVAKLIGRLLTADYK
jgi:hypothetical protein